MPRFFVRGEQITEENGIRTVHITGEDAHHISRALRMAKGEVIEVCDMQKNLYLCRLNGFFDGEVTALVEESGHADTEPRAKITLYQALPKSDKMETIIQKSIECGVFEIVPFKSERCIVKLDKKDEAKKLDRWQKIAESAAKQSGRGIIPTVKGALTFDEMISDAKKAELSIFCYEGEDTLSVKEVLKSIDSPKSISVIVGAEGGFSKRETEKITEAGIRSVSLGKRILRCETAPTFVLSCIAYETEL